MKLQHYLQFSDFTADEYAWLFQRAALILSEDEAAEIVRRLAPLVKAFLAEQP